MRGKAVALESKLSGEVDEFIVTREGTPGGPRITLLNYCFLAVQSDSDVHFLTALLKEPDIAPLVRVQKRMLCSERDRCIDAMKLPIVITESELDPILKWFESTPDNDPESRSISPGTKVEIRMSCFSGQHGVVVGPGSKGRVVVEVVMFGRPTPVSIKANELVIIP